MLLALAPSSLLAPRAPPPRRCGGVRCAAAAGGSPADALRADQDLSLIRRGERERGLLQEGTALEMPRRAAKAAKAGGARGGSAGGFGGAKAPKAKAAGKSKGKRAAVGGAARDAQELADELRREGVVRIDGGLTPATADALAAYVDALRATSAAEVAAGADASSRFADLVLVESRCDEPLSKSVRARKPASRSARFLASQAFSVHGGSRHAGYVGTPNGEPSTSSCTAEEPRDST